jgi:hypothetical protein
MNTAVRIIFGLAFGSMVVIPGQSQTGFSPVDYIQFLEEHQDYTAQQLIQDHPVQTTYYENRQSPTDLASIHWFDSIDNRFQLTADEKTVLAQNHFMVSERIRNYDWASAFISIYSSDLPLFLSSDFVLSTLHQSYDVILQTLEWQFLEPNLIVLLQAMYGSFPDQVEAYAHDARFEPILKDVDLYISVALSLAIGAERLPQYDSPAKFHEMMEAIDAEQMAYLPLFTESRLRKLDFSQFAPRGHYNKEIYTRDGTITLENYFRAMMWLGRIDFLLTAPPENPWEPDWEPEELRRMQLGALLLNELLYDCGKVQNLEKHEEIISFLVGPDDNLTPEELHALRDDVLERPDQLFNEEEYLQFTASLNESDDYGQKIMSNFFFVDPFSADPGELPVSYKLLGQKFLLDSYVFSEVVYDRIVYQGEKVWRPLPDPLDVMAALGNEDALALLEGELEQYKYAGKMAGLKYLIDAYDPGFWEQSMYNRWLDAIRSLNPQASIQGFPYFMQTTAWHQEKLNTQLTAWAQLRHDNILYGKQSYTGGTGCSYPYTYIEPYPELYGKIHAFASEASLFFERVLQGEQLEAKDHILRYYDRYAELMLNFKTISEKQLDRIPLTEPEVTFLKTMINSYMASGPSITGWYNELFFDASKGVSWDFTVADVHTQPTDEFGAVVGNVLHVGNGLINMGVFLAENPCNPGQLMAFTGPVSSFHQQVTAQFRRLTDQDWEEGFFSGMETPERPDWIGAFLLNSEGTLYPEGRTLKGALFSGTGMEPAHRNLIDYMLLFPNPVREETNLRFVLNEGSEFRLEAYDASGRRIYSGDRQHLEPAEHHMVLSVGDWKPGIYLIKVAVGSEYQVRQLVVQ